MKNIILFLFIPVCLNSQTLNEVFSPQNLTITWLGVDFTHGTYNVTDRVRGYLPDICQRMNKNIASDHHRYYFPIAYKKDFLYDTKYIDEVNNSISESVLVDGKREIKELNVEKITAIVAGYEFPKKMSGIGLLYIYESINQRGPDKGTVWMVLLNIQTKEILFLQNTTSSTDGKSTEEAWAYPVLSMIRKTKGDISKWWNNADKYNLMLKK